MGLKFKEELVRVEFVVGEDVVRESITEELEVPEQKPDIERILDVTAEVADVEALIEDGGVDLDGQIEVGVLYVADAMQLNEPQQAVHFFEGSINFGDFIDIPEAQAGMHVITDVEVTRVSIEFIDERTVEVSVVIRIFVKVTEFRQVNLITKVIGFEKKDIIIKDELLKINNVVDENISNTIVSGEIDIPKEKPPIERILRLQGEIIDEVETEIIDGAVIVEGNIDVGIVYVAETIEGDQPVHFAKGTINFSEAIDIAGVFEDQDLIVFTDVTVRRLSDKIIDPDTARVEVVIEIFVKVMEPRQVCVVTDIKSKKVKFDRELLRVEEVIGENIVTERITRNITLPAGKPDIERILEIDARVFDPVASVEDGGVLIEGEIKGTALYVADIDDPVEFQQPVHFVSEFFDFQNFVQVPGALEGMNAKIDVSVINVRANLVNQRTIELIITLRKFAKVLRFRQLEILVDLVGVSPIVDKPADEKPSFIIYVVQPGDTLFKIARRFGTTIDAIVEANDIANPDQINVGQKLSIPKGIVGSKC